ncbi:MAG: hypothetical protein LUE99_16485 [Bacteroides sp.]|nr:hypothetical protein [Bacteroides sp.]
MKNLFTWGAGILFTLLSLSACDDNHANYPKEYVGFDKTIEKYIFNSQAEEQDISIKIIAAEKSGKDREVALSGHWKPGKQSVFKLLDRTVVIPAKKKAATARIRVYPKPIKRTEEIRIVCAPKDTEVKQSQLTLELAIK